MMYWNLYGMERCLLQPPAGRVPDGGATKPTPYNHVKMDMDDENETRRR